MFITERNLDLKAFLLQRTSSNSSLLIDRAEHKPVTIPREDPGALFTLVTAQLRLGQQRSSL